MGEVNKRRAVAILVAIPGLAFLEILVGNLATLIRQFSWNSDADSAKNLATAILAGAPGAHIFTQQAGFIWMDVLTGWLPAHTQIWTAIPWLFGVATIGLLAWMGWVLGGRMTALLTAVFATAMSPTLLPGFLINTFHGYAWTTAALFGAAVVGFAKEKIGRRSAIALGILGAVSVATDPLAAVSALAPLVLVGGLFLWTKQRQAAVLTGVTAGTSVVGFGAVQILMHWLRFSGGLPGATQQGIPSISSIWAHTQLLWNGLLDMVNGRSMTLGQDTAAWWTLLASVLVVGMVCISVWAAIYRFKKERGDAKTLYTVYWVIGAALLAGALVFTNTALPGNGYDPANEIVFAPVRYMTPIFLGAAAVIPLWATESIKRLVPVGVAVAVLALSSTFALSSAISNVDFHPGAANDLAMLSNFLQSKGLQRGYTSYWDAQAINWNSGGQVPLFAAAEGSDCGQTGDVMCFFAYNAISSWFKPTLLPTAVIVDPVVSWVQVAPPASLGSPTSVDHVGRFTVYWYSYDVSTKFIAKCAGRTDHSCG